MDWRSAKIILASAATVVVASQVVKSLYKRYFTPKKPNFENDDTCSEVLKYKNREINDVILFSNENIVRHTIQTPTNKNVTICESRELNCFKLIKYIKSARETLDVCMYLITSSDIAEHIIRLGQKHVLVRVIVDNDMADSPASQIKKLKEFSFITVQTNVNSVHMHHKFCIVDGPKAIKRKYYLKSHAEKLNAHTQFTKPNVKPLTKLKHIRGFVMSGSLNWSTQAMVSNNDSVIVTSNSTIVNKFEKEFEGLWLENEPALKTME